MAMRMGGGFDGFVKMTERFRTHLAKEMCATVWKFCPTDEQMEQYTERWLAAVRKERHIGYTHHSDDGYIDTEDVCGNNIPATESEMRYKMLNFLDNEDEPMVEMFGQIDNYEQPTTVRDEFLGRILNYPYCDCEVAIYQRDMFNVLSGNGNWCADFAGEFAVRVMNDEVEKWMTAWVRKYIVKGHAI
jgi:hypothetical protein